MSAYGVGAVLSQKQENQQLPIAFELALLTKAQKNYSQLHKEALAVIFGITKFHKYHYGRSFTIFTDHQPLKSLFLESRSIPAMTAARIIRWSILLFTYNYKIVYKKGANIPQVDVMSCLPNESQVPDQNCNFLFLSTPLISLETVAQHTIRDRSL